MKKDDIKVLPLSSGSAISRAGGDDDGGLPGDGVGYVQGGNQDRKDPGRTQEGPSTSVFSTFSLVCPASRGWPGNIKRSGDLLVGDAEGVGTFRTKLFNIFYHKIPHFSLLIIF